MNLGDFYAALFMLIRDGKIENAAITKGSSYIKPFTEFNYTSSIVEYARNNY
mgnify:CR=1 FL=1